MRCNYHEDAVCQSQVRIHSAVAILLVLSATTSSCERSFSGLRRLKIYLRSSMSQEILNSLIIAAARTETFDTKNQVDIAKDFISRNETRERMYRNFGQ